MLSFALVGSVGGLGSWLGVSSWKTSSLTKVLLGLSIFRASDQKSVGTGWSGHNQLIESEAFATSLNDSSSSRFGESKSSDGHLWDIHESSIVGDGSDGNNNLILSLKELSNL